jgi:hypothetical protein
VKHNKEKQNEKEDCLRGLFELSERGLLGMAVSRHIERHRGAVSCEQSFPWLLHKVATANFCLGVFCFGVSRIVGAWLAWHGSVTPH